MGTKISPTMLRVLTTAAARERGNVIPMAGLNGGSQRVVLKAMERLGFIEYDGIYVITAKGREAVAAKRYEIVHDKVRIAAGNGREWLVYVDGVLRAEANTEQSAKDFVAIEQAKRAA
jgi:DNA-binding PadR family transcriptional regulator